MRELSLFTGAGGGLLGSILLKWTTVGAVEIKPYCQEVLRKRQEDGMLPQFPIWGDIKTFNGRLWNGKVDVISGGFPCQPFSRASSGKRTAIDLWPEMRRVIDEVKPRFVFAENVTRESIKKAGEDLNEDGYAVRFTGLSAAQLGADHVRRRFWLLAYPNDDGELCCEINAKTSELSKFRPFSWTTDPGKSRVSHGVAHRMDRFRAIGNGQVPAVVRAAWHILTEGIYEKSSQAW